MKVLSKNLVLKVGKKFLLFMVETVKLYCLDSNPSPMTFQYVTFGKVMNPSTSQSPNLQNEDKIVGLN